MLPHLVLISVGVFVVAVAAGLAAAVVSALRAWRVLRRFQRRTGAKLTETSTLIARVERRAAGAGDRAARLDEARESLRQSLATLRVMTGGTREALSLFGRVRGLMPRK